MKRAALSLLAVAVPLLGAAALRAWGFIHHELVWHPDEIFMVVIPLGLFSGDLNPHQFHYPSAHFYLLGATYCIVYLVDLARGATGGLYEWVSLHGLFEMVRLRDIARWVSFIFSVATVSLTGLIAGRLSGPSAAVVAASAMAVSVLHVRQSQIASVDTAMTFWFLAALWAALRLADDGRRRAYILCGILVGLCAGTKYPGVAAAGGVLGAHLLAGRAIVDRRLWTAGLVSVVTFLLVSPYVWLDADTFVRHFRFQVYHVRSGTGDGFLPVFHHLWFSLRYNLGEPAWLAALGAVAWALSRRDRQLGVVLVASVSAYALVSWGNLVFIRYALPLLPLQAILVGVTVVALASKLAQYRGPRLLWIGVLTAAILVLPTARTLRVVAISAAVDTRSQAAQWMTQHVPSGSRICNFGGWGGDVQVRSYEQLWWLLLRHEKSYGLAALEEVAPRLQLSTTNQPYYSFTAGGDRSASENGSWDLVDDVQCDYVLTHDHPLPASRLDSAFVAGLPERGQRLVSFRPGTGVEQAAFDGMDAYYIPFANMDGVDLPGPTIEIWRINGQPSNQRPVPSVNERLATAHALLSMSATRDGEMALALRALHHASRFDPTDARAVDAWGRFSSELGRTPDAKAAFDELNRLEPEHAEGLEGLSRLLEQAGRWPEAAQARAAAARLQPHSVSARSQWAYALTQSGENRAALQVFRDLLQLHSEHAATNHAIGTILFQLGDTTAASDHLDRAVQLEPQNAGYHLDAGVAHGLNHPVRALRLWRGAAELDSTLVNAHRYIAYAAQDMGDTTLALAHWNALRALHIADGKGVEEGARALLDLGHGAAAAAWVQAYLQTQDDTTASESLQQILRTAQGVTGPAAKSP